MFVNYWFIIFAGIFFPIFWLCKIPKIRKMWLLLACVIFHYRFAGAAGVIPIIFLGVVTYFAGISNNKTFRTLTIILCVSELIFYKYSIFFISQVIGYINADFAQTMLSVAKDKLLPTAPPLAISFFVFEFVHYLVDLQRGKQPIRSVGDFTLFSIFWPSVVSGPIKRFEQFLPSIVKGCENVNAMDIQIGLMRITMGLVKKLIIADNLNGYISYYQPNFATLPYELRWLIFIAISLRILFDFSGYSDMAIGFARLMGIRLPENFNWPYLASSLQDFWRRWHISLSSWIRDYIYIPLGGNQCGMMRKISNGIIAFGICGLWHGAAWNFIFWGIYHGIGLVVSTNIKSFFERFWIINKMSLLFLPFTWFATLTFVSVGWLYFFYPVSVATSMIYSLIYRY
ncbi:MAG: MBOAT family O-acyltransferase [Gammaproteobacteria bacterium]|nr:MBOAT family O-acyltransferase [Gammaproteobacteria bacterium]